MQATKTKKKAKSLTDQELVEKYGNTQSAAKKAMRIIISGSIPKSVETTAKTNHN